MKKDKISVTLLLIQILLAAMFHIGSPLLEDRMIESKRADLMLKFNRDLHSNIQNKQILNYIKILINNYESVENKSILDSRNIEDLKNACTNLNPVRKKIFLLYSLKMNLAILGAVLLPGISYSFKKLFRNSL